MLGFVWVNVYAIPNPVGEEDDSDLGYHHHELVKALFLPKVVAKWYQKRLRRRYLTNGLHPCAIRVYLEAERGAWLKRL